MHVSFLTPTAGLFALTALVPLAAFVAFERRAAAVRRAFSLAGPRRRTHVPVVLSLVLLPALVATAVTQPVIVRDRRLTQRADTEVFFVIDTSLSMEARKSAHGLTRLARAKQAARLLDASLNDIPAGLASMTDRVLPVLLPTTDHALFERVLTQAVGIDRPPPSERHVNRATTYEPLIAMLDRNFFTPGVEHRIIVVLTDGEAVPPSSTFRVSVLAEEADIATRGGSLSLMFVHVWAPHERIYVRGDRVDSRYISDPSSGTELNRYAALTGGHAFAEGQLRAVTRAINLATRTAPSWRSVETASRVPLAPWLVLAGVLPLGFLVFRRNV